VTWPKSQRPDWMSPDEYAAMPQELRLRDIRVRIKDLTKRTRRLVIVTTLLDAKKYSASALRHLFRQRWHAELDIRSIKTTMRMEMLRTKTPDTVRKEVGMQLLAYNLIRGVMAEAARGCDVQPRELSFNGARQTVRACIGSRSLVIPPMAASERCPSTPAISFARIAVVDQERPDLLLGQCD
jgi:Transposase DDE domain